MKNKKRQSLLLKIGMKIEMMALLLVILGLILGTMKASAVFAQTEGSNLIVNPNFDSGASDWSFWSEKSSGNKSAQITTGSTAPQGWGRVACVTQGSAYGPTNANFSNASLFAGKQFKLSGYIKTTSGTSAYFKVSVHTSGGSWNPNWSPGTTGNVSSTSWQYVEKTFTILSNVDGIYLDGCSSGSAGGKTWFDYLRLTRVDNGQNLVNDSGFETGTSNWGLWSEAQGTAYQSEYKLDFVAESPKYAGEVVSSSGGYTNVYQITTGIEPGTACVKSTNLGDLTSYAGKQFKLSGYLRTSGSGTNDYLKFNYTDGSWHTYWAGGMTSSVNSSSWTYVEKTFILPNNVLGAYVDGCSYGAIGGQAWLDNIKLVRLLFPPSPPTGLAPSCFAPGTSAIVTWGTVSGATSYALRVDDMTDGSDNTCSSLPDGLFCEILTNNYRGFTSIPGHSYRWWVHAINLDGWSSYTLGPNFTCQICTPGAKRCSGDSTLEQCNSSGTGWTTISCGAGKYCFNNACVDIPPLGCYQPTKWSVSNNASDIGWNDEGSGSWWYGTKRGSNLFPVEGIANQIVNVYFGVKLNTKIEGYVWDIKDTKFQTSYCSNGVLSIPGAEKVNKGKVELYKTGSSTPESGVSFSNGHFVKDPISQESYTVVWAQDGDKNFEWQGNCYPPGTPPVDIPGSGCTPRVDIAIAQFKDPWWQVIGGDIHADGGSVNSQIPNTCTGSCQPYLMLDGASLDHGVVSYTGGLTIGDGTTIKVPDNIAVDNRWRAQSAYEGKEYKYAFWNSHLSAASLPNCGSPPTTNCKITSSSIAWGALGTKKIVALRGGDLTVSGNITVANGGSLVVITSGNIGINKNVTKLQGYYFADGTISTGSDDEDEKLEVEGGLIGWSGINLERDFGSSENNTNPAEVFTFRPDILFNLPEELRIKDIRKWKEVAP